MKFTSKDLMEAMGLQVGDKVAFNYGMAKVIFKVNENELEYENGKLPLFNLLNRDFEILPSPKKIGDLKCGEYGQHNCASCPIRAICVSDEYNEETLYSKLELSHKYALDQEIYDLLKARLDKEVNVND